MVVLFSLKSKITFQNEAGERGEGLTYNTEVLENLINKDSDLDGVVDWEEDLWGTNPLVKDTDGDGIWDNDEITQLRKELVRNTGVPPSDTENLTTTDKFSQELLSTIAALNQSGELDPESINHLGATLAQEIENAPQKRVFGISDIKVVGSSIQAAEKYVTDLNALSTKYPPAGNPIEVLSETLTTEGDVDTALLYKLDPLIIQMGNIVTGMLGLEVPQKISAVHLELLNAIERTRENLSDIKLMEQDALIAFSAMNQLEANDNQVTAVVEKLNATLQNEF